MITVHVCIMAYGLRRPEFSVRATQKEIGFCIGRFCKSACASASTGAMLI